MKKIYFLLFLLSPLILSAQTIAIFAGTEVSGYSGDGLAATTATLNGTYGVAADNVGNVYIADYLNHRIRKVNPMGIISTFAGNGTGGYTGDGILATDAELYYPTGVCVDISGNVYISDYFNNRIRKVNTSGVIGTVAGSWVGGYSGDGGSATIALINRPWGVAVDRNGNVYISDRSNKAIRKVDTSGIIKTIAGGGTTGLGDGGPATAAELNYPTGVAVDSSGNVYVADNINNRVRKIDTSGIITTYAGNGLSGSGGIGVMATSVAISAGGVAVDDSGNIYIANEGYIIIHKVNSSGEIYRYAGIIGSGTGVIGGLATACGLGCPYAVAVDGIGNLYIADMGFDIVEKVSSGKRIDTPALGINGFTPESPIALYPNPTQNELTISAIYPITNIIVGNLLGQTVYTHEYNTEQVQVDVADLPAGMYLVRINGSEVRKFVKQ